MEETQPFEKKERIPPPPGWQPELTFPEDHRWHSRPRCLNWNFNTGRQCGKTPKKGRAERQHPLDNMFKEKCRSHGGNARSGINHPNFQGKGKARVVRPGIEDIYNRAVADPELLNLQHDVAYAEAMLFDLSNEIAQGVAPWVMFDAIKREWVGLWEAWDREDEKDLQHHRRRIDTAINGAVDKIKLIQQLIDLADSKRRLVEAEAKRRISMKYMVLVEDAMQDYVALAQVVQRILTTETEINADVAIKVLEKIRDEFDNIVQGSTQGLPPPG